eukprot:GDKJ01049364.1.p1 GENE.GDKJ01049364.1~~GDKJ01049364.1.p1  ORF type:complete len:643 (+),score=174.32 GDKJ01049364.1:68-1996(+)
MYNHSASTEDSYVQNHPPHQAVHQGHPQQNGHKVPHPSNTNSSGALDALRMSIISRRYKINEVIGAGSYGCVYQAEDRTTGKYVAIKKMQRIFDDLVDCKRILREVSLLSRMRHNNTVRLIDMIIPDPADVFDEIYLVLEIADSDFKKLFRAQVHLTEPHIKTLLYNMLVGLKYIHACGVLHRDIKPANCLVNTDCAVKICDFGLARTTQVIPESYRREFQLRQQQQKDAAASINQPQSDASTRPHSAASHTASPPPRGLAEEEEASSQRRQMTGHVVTRWYRAPELILLQENYDAAVDVWSAGCIFGELLNMLDANVPHYSDRVPMFPGGSCFPLSPCKNHATDYKYHMRDERDQLNMIFNLLGTPAPEDLEFLEKEDAKKYVKIFEYRAPQDMSNRFPGISAEGINLLSGMLTFSPLRRLTLEQCLNHPYLADVRVPLCEVLPANLKKITLPYDDWNQMTEAELRYVFVSESRAFFDHNRPNDPHHIPVPCIPKQPSSFFFVPEVTKPHLPPQPETPYQLVLLPDLSELKQNVQACMNLAALHYSAGNILKHHRLAILQKQMQTNPSGSINQQVVIDPPPYEHLASAIHQQQTKQQHSQQNVASHPQHTQSQQYLQQQYQQQIQHQMMYQQQPKNATQQQ